MSLKLYQSWAEVHRDRALLAWLGLAGAEPARYVAPEVVVRQAGIPWDVLEALIDGGYAERVPADPRMHVATVPCRLSIVGFRAAQQLRTLSQDRGARWTYAEEVMFRWVDRESAVGGWAVPKGYSTNPASWFCGTELSRDERAMAVEALIGYGFVIFDPRITGSRLSPEGRLLARSGKTVREYMAEQKQPGAVNYTVGNVTIGNVGGSVTLGNNNYTGGTSAETSDLAALLAELRSIADSLPAREAEEMRGYASDLEGVGEDHGRAARVWGGIRHFFGTLAATVTPDRLGTAIDLGERLYRQLG
ncbi:MULTISPECIES: hypothetical protein [unclassified Kitasatospora]|uniref:hypothetical protein n=1 Tax=unclassified Kitasatospora TaxID=2633591 RepID=UPI003406C92E